MMPSVTRIMSNSERADEEPADAAASERDDDHLRDIDDGCGCTEVWEAMSEYRDNPSAADDD